LITPLIVFLEYEDKNDSWENNWKRWSLMKSASKDHESSICVRAEPNDL
jgi:hypothetical protein